jgi:phage terminase large subunit GpA-like protein
MPVGSPRPGPWSNDYTPYLIETMQNLSPSSPVQREIVMKGAQGGWTAAAENVICYFIDEMPSNILFVSATDKLLERWATTRLEPAIDSCGIRPKIQHETMNQASKRSGDKMYSKEYSGCRMDMASARSSPSLSATDKRILIRDEIDRAPTLLTTGEGNWMKVSYARTNFWGARRKVYDLSTPTLEGESQIHEAYKTGDCRKFLIPCPRCGVFQELRFGSEDTQYGLKPDTKAGELQQAYYLCDHCHDAFFNDEKYSFLPLGYWEAEKESNSPTVISRHWPSFYAPIGTLSWTEIYMHYLEALDDPLGGMQTFVNLYLGLPYKAEGTRPSPKKITRGTYNRGTVPDGVLYLTAGVDVQAGKKKDKKKPARLEMEICGHGLGYRTWSVDYKVIKGAVTDAFDGAWQKFREMFLNGEMDFRREDGISIPIKLILIDSQYQPDAVYQFCESGTSNIFASKGFKTLAQRKDEAIDEMTNNELKRYRLSKSGNHLYYTIATVFYKRIVYGTLNIPRQPMGPQKPGFCEFPQKYPEAFYRQLVAEEMRDGGKSFWLPTGRTNEALDCRVLNLAASHIWLDDQVKQKREFFKKQKCSEAQLKQIDSLYILNSLQAALDAEIKRVRAGKNSP